MLKNISISVNFYSKRIRAFASMLRLNMAIIVITKYKYLSSQSRYFLYIVTTLSSRLDTVRLDTVRLVRSMSFGHVTWASAGTLSKIRGTVS